MKWWLLFVLDLAAVACVVRAGFLTFAAKKAGPNNPDIDRAWVISEAAGWMVAACLAALAAFVVAVIPGD
jgi:hypothetical protein